MKTPTAWTKQNVDVWSGPDGRFVILGCPPSTEDEETGHSCDAMGCGYEHVVFRGHCDGLRTKESK